MAYRVVVRVCVDASEASALRLAQPDILQHRPRAATDHQLERREHGPVWSSARVKSRRERIRGREEGRRRGDGGRREEEGREGERKERGGSREGGREEER